MLETYRVQDRRMNSLTPLELAASVRPSTAFLVDPISGSNSDASYYTTVLCER